MAKKITEKQAPVAAAQATVKFVFVPQNSKTSTLGWPAAATGVVGLAVSPRNTKLVYSGVNGGRVLVDDVDVDAVLKEAAANACNTPMARQRTDLKKLWALEQQAYGIRVSEFNGTRAATKNEAGQVAELPAESAPADEAAEQ